MSDRGSGSCSTHPDDAFFDFTSFMDMFSADFSESESALLPSIGGRRIDEVVPDLVAAFQREGQKDLLREFGELCDSIITKETLAGVTVCWPPAVVGTEREKVMLKFLLRLIHESPQPEAVLAWWKKSISGRPRRACHGAVRSAIYGVTKKGKCHGIIDVAGTLRVVNSASTIVAEAKISSIHRDGKNVKFMGTHKSEIAKFVLANKADGDIWATASDVATIPDLLKTLKGMPPQESVMYGFLDIVTADDMAFVRALSEISTTEDRNGIAQDLLCVFSCTEKINQLFLVLVGDEIAKSTLNGVFRIDSLATYVIKALWRQYGKDYQTHVLNKIVKYVDAKGPLDLNDRSDKNVKGIGKVLFTVLRCILCSGKFVPPQIRHFASIVKGLGANVFNSQAGAYNSLSSMFFLRFIVSAVFKPEQYDKTYTPRTDIKLVTPFVKILQETLNAQIGKKPVCEMLENWSAQLNEHVYPELRNLVFALSEPPDGDVCYKIPTQEKLNRSLVHLMEFVGRTDDRFYDMYASFKEKPAVSQPTEWCMEAFLCSFFKNACMGAGIPTE